MILSAAFAASCLLSIGQGLPPTPADDVNLRLEMAGTQMEKAGRARLYGAMMLIAGGAFAAITTADPENTDLPIIVAGGTVLVSTGFTIKGALHDGKAGQHLNRRK